MRIHSPPFEAAMVRAYRRELAASPALKREWWRLWRGRLLLYGLTALFYVPLGVWFIGFPPFMTEGVEGRPLPPARMFALDLGGVLLWFVLSWWLKFSLYGPSTLGAMARLPIPDGEIFRRARNSFILQAGKFAFCGWALICLMVLRVTDSVRPGWSVGLATAGAQALLALGAAMFLGGLSRPVFEWGTQSLKWMFPFLLAAFAFIIEEDARRLQAWFGELDRLLPTSWFTRPFHASILQDGALEPLQSPGVPVGIGLAVMMLVIGMHRLRKIFPLFHLTTDESPGERRDAEVMAPSTPGSAAVAKPDEAAIRDELRKLLEPAPWTRRGGLESLVGAWMNPRERVLCDAWFGRAPRWTTIWLLSFLVNGLAFAVFLQTSWAESTMMPMLASLAALMAILANLLPDERMRIGGTLPAAWEPNPLAALPMNWIESTWMMTKIAFIRWLLVFPHVAMWSVLLAFEVGPVERSVAGIPIRAWLIILVALPALCSVATTASTDCIGLLRLRGWANLVVLFGCVTLGLAGGAFFLVYLKPTYAWGLVAVVVGSIGWVIWMARRFARGGFDYHGQMPMIMPGVVVHPQIWTRGTSAG